MFPGFPSSNTQPQGQQSQQQQPVQHSQQTAASLFGSGSTTGSGLFGKPSGATTFPSTAAPSSNPPLFSAPNSGTSLFGSSGTAPLSGGTGITQPASHQTSGTSLFGGTSGGFSAAPVATSTFGAPTTTNPVANVSNSSSAPPPTAGTSGFSLLGQQPQSLQQPPGGGLFGSGTASSTSGTSLFSQPAAPSTTTPALNLFSSTQPTTAAPSTSLPSFNLSGPSTTASQSISTVPGSASIPVTSTVPTQSLPFSFKPPATNTSVPTASASVKAESIQDGTTPSSATVAASIPSSVQLPSAIKNKTLAQILISWKEELERQSSTFHTLASTLAQHDASFTRTANQVLKLASQVTDTEARAQALHSNLDALRQDQGEMERTLDLIEGELPMLIQQASSSSVVGSINGGPQDSLLADTSATLETIQQLVQRIDPSKATDVITADYDENEDTYNATGMLIDLVNKQLTSLRWTQEQIAQLTGKTLKDTTALHDRATHELSRRGY